VAGSSITNDSCVFMMGASLRATSANSAEGRRFRVTYDRSMDPAASPVDLTRVRSGGPAVAPWRARPDIVSTPIRTQCVLWAFLATVEFGIAIGIIRALVKKNSSEATHREEEE
jgi:hypothetical protein